MLILRKIFKIIQNENFSKIRLQNSSLEGMCFINCNFQGSKMENVKLIACRFIGCCFDNVNWKNMISIEQTVFQGDNKKSEIKSLAISDDETMFATCSSDDSIQLWDLKTYEKVKSLRVHNTIYQIGFFSNKFLVVRFSQHSQIWNIASEKRLQQYKTYGSCSDYYSQLLFHQLMMGYRNPKLRTIYLLSIKKEKILRKYSVNISQLNKTLYSSMSLLAVQEHNKKIIIWDFQKGQYYFEIKSNYRKLKSPIISPERDFIALISQGFLTNDVQIQVWDIKNKIQFRQIQMLIPSSFYYSELISEFSKNGTILAFLDGFQNIHFFDILANQIILTLNNLCISTFNLLLYPKTNIILTYQKNNIMLLDPITKQKKAKQIILNQDELIFNSTFFSKEGKQILVFYDRTKIQRIDLDRGENLRKKNIANAVQVTCSLDLQTILVLKRDQKIVYLQNMKSQKVFKLMIKHFKVNSIAISPSNLILVCGNEDSTIKLFNLKTLKQIQIYKEHSKAVKIILFSQDGQKLVSGALDRTIRIWDLRNHQLIAKFEQYNGNFVIALSLDSNVLAEDSKQHIIFWDLKKRTKLSNLSHKDKDEVKTILFLNYFLILVQFSHFSLIWDYKTGLIVHRFLETFWYSVLFSPKSKILAIFAKEDFQLYTIQQEKKIKKLTTNKSSIISIKICSQNQTLVTFLQDYSLNIWNLQSNLQRKKRIEEQQSIINSFSLSQSGNILVYGCKDSTICLWDIKSLQQMQKFKSHQSVNSIDFSHDEQYLAFGCQNGMIYLWDIKRKKQSSKKMATNYSPITQITFLKDQIITLHSDNTIHFWNIKEQLQELGYYKHLSVINSVTLSFDQQTLAFGSNDGKVYILNVSSRTIVQEYAFHNDKVNCVSFSSDDKYLASGSDDESVCLIDINSGGLIDRFFINEGKVTALVHLYDKQVIVQGNENGVINMISFDQKKIDLIKIYGKDSLSLKGTKSSFSDAKITSSNGFDIVKVLQKDQ